MIEVFGFSPHSFLNYTATIQKISKIVGLTIPPFSSYKGRDLILRAALCDYEGVSKIAGIDSKKAEYISILLNFKPGKLKEYLGTIDSKRLRKDILEAFARNATSSFGGNIIRSLLPTISVPEVKKRQKFVKDAISIYKALKEADILNDTRQLLKRLEIGVVESNEDDIKPIDYVTERFSALAVALDIDELFSSSKTSKHFLDEERLRAARQVISAIEDFKKRSLQKPESLLNDEELMISEELQEKEAQGDDARSIIERHIGTLSDKLKLSEREELILRRAAFSSFSLPFSFDRVEISRLLVSLKEKLEEERKEVMDRLNRSLEELVSIVDEIVISLIKLDISLAIAEKCEELSLEFPQIAEGGNGIAFVNGRNFFLLQSGSKKDAVEPVSYSLGKTGIDVGAKPRNVVMLTGANSGGKTTLLNTVACIAMMTSLGFPVPAERSEVALVPLYLFRRKMTRSIGSLEHALRSLRPIFATRLRKLILIDEFEALTEPGAAGRILASIVNFIAPTSSLLLLVTHLARETLPHIRFRIRVDGIEAAGLNDAGELMVNRQPIFDHVGSSTPQLVIMKLLKSRGRGAREREVYQSMLLLLEEKGEQPVQTPIYTPWIENDA